ncbi:hypothetical protein D1007_29810 [Hordeum vulgare]|nr:hypothetical protein D1007_29810 [Hordeum vulgare]
MGPVVADPIDRRTTLSGERWNSSESESSARSHRDVARTPPPIAAPPAAVAPGRVVPTTRQPVKDCLDSRSEVHRFSGGPVLDADGFQQPS